MNRSARNVEATVRNPGIVGGGVSARSGLISRLVRRLARPEPRKTTAEEAAWPESSPGRDPNASRSAMDAGITGGMMLLISGSRDRSHLR